MRGTWDAVLKEVLPEYQRLSASGDALSAVAKLGEVLAVADKEESHRARVAVRSHVTADLVEHAAAEAVRVRGHALHVLSIGSEFVWDELVLLLTMRMQLELASLVMDSFGIDTSAFDLATVDVELREVASSKQNRARFVSALATIRRNWDIQIEDKWST
jgi:hypothetical protein